MNLKIDSIFAGTLLRARFVESIMKTNITSHRVARVGARRPLSLAE